MKSRITIQDIADALGLSRNTVSKAINNTGSISEETKQKIFKKASELGYKQFGLLTSPACPEHSELSSSSSREIALFTHSIIGSSHFSSPLLNAFQEKISHCGYKLTMYTIRDDFLKSCQLPPNFSRDTTDGIIIIELFDKNYTDFLCNLSIPTLFIDTLVHPKGSLFPSDLMYMENQNSSYLLISSLLKQGCKKIGFIGDYMHCHSFFERWSGYCSAVMDDSQQDYRKYCILENDAFPYKDPQWMMQKIKDLPELPDAFFCANDYLAICAMQALKNMDFKIPQDICICGFDDSAESRIIDPPLTTIHIPSTSMGYLAAENLLSRINHPDAPFRTTYVQTEIIYRNSTRRL